MKEVCTECLQTSVKHGGGPVIAWGCVSASGVGDPVKNDAIMKLKNGIRFQSTMQYHLERVSLTPASLPQHDNDPQTHRQCSKSWIEKH